MSSGSKIFGAGVLGTNYSTSSVGTFTYTASNTHNYNLTGTNAFTLGLLGINTYSNTFKSLTFTVQNGSTQLATTYTSRRWRRPRPSSMMMRSRSATSPGR